MNAVTGFFIGAISASAAWWIVLGPLGRGCVKIFGGV